VRAEADGCNSVKYNLTSDTISSIFRCYPAGNEHSLCFMYLTLCVVKERHAQMVPDKVYM